MRLVHPITGPFVVSPSKGPSTGLISSPLAVLGTLVGMSLTASASNSENSTLVEWSTS